ncbi:MAG: type I restriction enzyme HsdR N-terminal domain-containing protein [Methanobacteriaceae archaeon]|nr:type I restriction enzyme HsdR N-terminal domain-containing protein [Methanobacteriaceae archaeon]
MKRWLLSIHDNSDSYDIDKNDNFTFYNDKFAKKGDLIVIYRGSPLTCFSHFFTVKRSNKYQYHTSNQDKYEIEIFNKFKLPVPIQLQQLKDRNILEGWMTKFADGLYEIPRDMWIKFMDLVFEKNSDFIAMKSNKLPGTRCITDFLDIELIFDEVIKYDGLKSDNSNCCQVPLNEVATESMIIRPILRSLGWNTSDPCQVRQEYGIGRKKVDYALINGKSLKAFIEVKNFNEDLKPVHEEQLIDYCYLKKVNRGILTNGSQWIFYNFNFDESKYIPHKEKIHEITVSKRNKKQLKKILFNHISRNSLI